MESRAGEWEQVTNIAGSKREVLEMKVQVCDAQVKVKRNARTGEKEEGRSIRWEQGVLSSFQVRQGRTEWIRG